MKLLMEYCRLKFIAMLAFFPFSNQSIDNLGEVLHSQNCIFFTQCRTDFTALSRYLHRTLGRSNEFRVLVHCLTFISILVHPKLFLNGLSMIIPPPWYLCARAQIIQTMVPFPASDGGVISTSMDILFWGGMRFLVVFWGDGISSWGDGTSWEEFLCGCFLLLERTDPLFMKILRLDMGLGRIKNL